LGNDTDADHDPLTAVLMTGPAHGALMLSSNGSFIYTPTANYSGLDSFIYRANDGKAESNPATVTITINPINDPPALEPIGNWAAAEETTLNFTVHATDSGAPPEILTYNLEGAPGGASINASSGEFTWTPTEAHGPGVYTFTVRVTDNGAPPLNDEEQIVVMVTEVNPGPVAVDDVYNLDEDTVLTVVTPGVLGNDTDAKGNVLTAILVSGPSHGVLTLNADGSFGYTPTANYNGTDSFTYHANDGTADSNDATVTITVNAVNDAPVAVNDAYGTDEDSVLTVAASGALTNDTDVDGDPLTAVWVSGPSHGVSAFSSDGSFVYTPTLHYNGSDGFTYRANDGMADSNVATVTLSIVPAVIDHITLAPSSATIVAGQVQTYTVTAYDTHGTSRDVTTQAMFSITLGAGGSWTGNIYTSQRAGEWIAVAVYGSRTAVASLKVNPGAPRINVQVSPDTLMTNDGATAAITAAVADAFGNPFAGMTLSGSTSPSTLGSVGGLGITDSAGQSFGTWTAGNVAGVGTLSVGNGSITGTSAITLNNPSPVITSLSPTTVTAGGPAFTLVVTGTNFVGDSTVYWNGSARATTFINSGQLVAAILTNDIATSGWISVTVVNPAPGGGISNILFFTVEIRPATVGDYKLYLPLAAKNYAIAPDLVVERIMAASNSAQVVIKNQGNAPVVEEFWVDLYVNPNPVPTGVNQTWNDGRSAQGIVWGVTSTALPLMPGSTLTLTHGDTYFWPSLSRYEAIPAGIPIYAQVDSANANTTYGAVLENHEIAGGAYNNILGPVLSTLSTSVG